MSENAPVDKSKAYRAVEKLLGTRVVCTLSDGRQATGNLVCIDRRKNIILSDCTETRTIVSTDYHCCAASPAVQQLAQRHLQQAMVPGEHLVKVEVERAIYEAKVAPVLES